MNAPVTSPHSDAGFPQSESDSLVSNFSLALSKILPNTWFSVQTQRIVNIAQDMRY